MGYKGEVKFPLSLTAASVLERNRLVTITNAGVPAYGTYGSTIDGITRSRSDANDYATAVLPIDAAGQSFFVTLGGTLAAGGAVFCGASGVGLPSKGTVTSRSSISVTGTAGDKYIVPPNIDWEAGSHQNKVATKGASVWAYAAAVAGDVYFVTDEGAYVIWTGTAWATAAIVGYAQEVGASGNDIACYLPRQNGQVSTEHLDDGIRPAGIIVAFGQSVSENDSNAEIVVTDERIASTDLAFATGFAGATAASLAVLKAVCTANTLTLTLAGNGGAGTIINWMIVRKVS